MIKSHLIGAGHKRIMSEHARCGVLPAVGLSPAVPFTPTSEVLLL